MFQKVAYWITTILVALAYLAGGWFDFSQPPGIVEEMAKSGYPLFFFKILGIWKLGGGIVLLLPALPRLKEWAYAGMTINLTAACATHVHNGDPVGNVVAPLVILALMLVSWGLRPASRRLPGPWL